jgi:hypothetical protein
MNAPELHHPIWAQVRGQVSHYALSKVRQIMIGLDLTATTIMKDCSGSFERAWGLPCPHKIRELFRTVQPLQIEDFHMHWRLDREALPIINWVNIAQPPEYIQRGRRQDVTTTRYPSEFERIDNALRPPPRPMPGQLQALPGLQGGSQARRGQGRGRGGQQGVPEGILQPGESILRF